MEDKKSGFLPDKLTATLVRQSLGDSGSSTEKKPYHPEDDWPWPIRGSKIRCVRIKQGGTVNNLEFKV